MGASFPVQLTLRLPGLEDRIVALQRFAETVTDFTPFWNDYFAPNWYALMVKTYATEGGFAGDSWDPLSAQYAAWKQKHFPGQPIGVLSGRTRSSLTSPSDPHAVTLSSPSEFAVGTDLGYPLFLQLGTRRMVARPPMRVDDQFMVEVGKLLQRYAADLAKKERLA